MECSKKRELDLMAAKIRKLLCRQFKPLDPGILGDLFQSQIFYLCYILKNEC